MRMSSGIVASAATNAPGSRGNTSKDFGVPAEHVRARRRRSSSKVEHSKHSKTFQESLFVLGFLFFPGNAPSFGDSGWSYI